jgi:LysM repeat protein
MKRNTLKTAVTLLVCAFTLFALFPLSTVIAHENASPVQQNIGTNLLVNPGFEGIGKPQNNSLANPGNWTRETFNGEQRGEIFTPEGWVTWWQGGDFKVPECKVIPNEHPFTAEPKRIYEGYYSTMCFAFFGKMNAGYYQVVRNLQPGATVEGSFYAHAWSCGEDNPPLSCGDPSSFYFRVGIDPNGGTDPFSGNVVWSNAAFHYDIYGYVGPVQATVGQSGAVTFFTQAYGKWSVKHNDAYVDNPSLKLVSQGETPTNTPPPPPPTSEVPPTPQYTPTPRPDGAIVHTVVSGDTLYGIALAYDIPIEDIYTLNDIDSSTILQIGQEIVIAVSGGALPTPTPEVVATVESTPEVESTQEPDTGSGGGGVPAAPAQDKAALCTLAFFDANGDMFRQAENGEMLLPNVQMSLLDRSGPVDSYKTDGISEPWCFNNLEPGNYVLRHTPPSGYKAIDGGQLSFILSGGQAFNIELAYLRDENAPASDSGESVIPGEVPVEGETSTEDPGKMTNVLNTVLRVSGIIVLILAIAVAVLFVLSRRAS